MKVKTSPPVLEARDMLIHSQISDKTLNQTDALKCQSEASATAEGTQEKNSIAARCQQQVIFLHISILYSVGEHQDMCITAV